MRLKASILVLGLLAPVVRADPGVTPNEIRLGQAAAFTGPSAGLGIEVWRGAHAAFSEVNDAGGVHGRRIRVVVADDGYEANRAAAAALKLITQDQVFALFSGVGTPTILKTLPIVLRFHKTDGLFYFANFTGAQPQREPPFGEAVFNVRASYRQETRAMVDALVAAGIRKIGIYVQDDAYGQSGRDGVRRALAEHALQLSGDTSYPRGQLFAASNADQVSLLRGAGTEAVIAVGSYQACAGFVRDARTAGWNVPILNVSFVGADQMAALLVAEEKKTGRALATRLLNTQVVPSYDEPSIALVKRYRAAMERYKPVRPEGDAAAAYVPAALYSYGSIEGYVNARAFVAVLQKAGPELTRKGFKAAAEAMGAFDLELGAPATFSAERHQALDKVWLTHWKGGRWVLVDGVRPVLE